ncbi:putative protein kinase RLK-Pelle-L-LEC family [Helianthus annuus]|nr:putative protein kinase RLK-Pelle-L-LEC family [Helianthus annuus]
MVVFGYVSVKKWREMKTEMNIKAEVKRNPREFSYKELKTATNNFHSSQIIGHGSFVDGLQGVYIVVGTPAAVKRSLRSREAKSGVLGGVSAIAGLRHKNLVQLLGWCVKKGELLLVYELMPYGSIDSDIKSSNVMLDANLNARLGDFGLAKLIDHNKSPVSDSHGWNGRVSAPEYLHCGKATDKTDVYSYGVVCWRFCCGRRPIEREIGGPNMGRFWARLISGLMESLMSGSEEALMVGLSCVNPRSDMRPSMRRVLQVLNREAEETEVPSVKPKVSFFERYAFECGGSYALRRTCSGFEP